MLMDLNQSGLFFVPKRWQRASVIRWLKRAHAWAGFWGALLFLTMGVSGITLNHREKLKIDTGEPAEVSAMDIAVKPGSIPDEKALGRWAKAQFGLRGEGRPPRGGDNRPGGGGKRFMGKVRPEAPKWALSFNAPDGKLDVSYVPGSASVAVRQSANGFFGTLKNLHKGIGLGLAWVLFIDTIAGALITMSLTGFLLWSRLHGPRLLAGGIVLTSLSVAAAAVWPFWM